MKKPTRPRRVLIGIGGVVVVGVGAIAYFSGGDTDDDSGGYDGSAQTMVNVERRHYASQSDCLRIWDGSDCRDVLLAETSPLPEPVAPTQVASGPLGVAMGTTVAPLAVPVAAVLDDETGWYGPYYTQQGVIYHASGAVEEDLSVVRLQDAALSTSTLTVNECELEYDRQVLRRTPKAEAAAEAALISRGGFVCPVAHASSGGHGGSGGGSGRAWFGEESGGHGGEHGVGHGGGHGSGGG
ncbi:hypothetical protein [Robbsia sp. KACC 23696]|uniref:hypothetical protein n=1 Tax=Robbsia sp. KACC 23696 TaxID=3149231 RepID=UPI00325B866B